MHTKFECLLSKSLTTLEVMSYYLVVHTGPDVLTMSTDRSAQWRISYFVRGRGRGWRGWGEGGRGLHSKV